MYITIEKRNAICDPVTNIYQITTKSIPFFFKFRYPVF
ncbi:hypothetical protein SDC9_133508 [bioreactor metagenome]|uniref:Uncharacterized protein n=1 Tax=bioreactor metagenome TaxID=1076179 RepID=A0A645DB34_9ZZZZ